MKDLECNTPIKRDITISECKENNLDDCNRSYYEIFPTALCEEQLLLQMPTTLPLVFAIHCFGCSATTMFSLIQYADEHNLVLIVPEGVNHSWNARYCCGYALDNKLDDIGFIAKIQSRLSEEYAFVNPTISYAIGWSNGGFFVMHGSTLFRGIAPVSGNIAEIGFELKKDALSDGKALFLHHGMDDHFVQPTGCCNDPNFPKCCCGIVANTCTSVFDVARSWATEVNGCPNDESLLSETSYTNDEKGIQCQTSSNCKANTTICMYEHSGHFNTGPFHIAFLMASEVMNFFARDACQVNDGSWNSIEKTCSCGSTFTGPFCLNEIEDRDEGTGMNFISLFMIAGLALVILVSSYIAFQKQRRRSIKYTKVEVEMT